MHTITLTEDEMITLEMALVDLLDAIRDTEDEEAFAAVENLLNKVTAQGGVSMSYFSNLDYEINELLDTTRMSCEEIAASLQCPVQFVNDVVEQRWNERVSAA